MAGQLDNCIWNFPVLPENISDSGYNNSMTENFKKQPYASLVRESIQNSLDAALLPNEPVEMVFEVKTVEKNNIESFLTIGQHIFAAREYYKEKKDAQNIYTPMIDYIKDINTGKQKFHYIRVSDYNTTGMTYKAQDQNNGFYAFVRSAGVSDKSDASKGGSFGFGKAAYFYLSQMRALLVSTLDIEEQYFFEGVSSLCTHRLVDGKKRSNVGYFDSNGGEPITDIKEIPKRFQKRFKNPDDIQPESGTDIFIMGIDMSEHTIDSIYQEMKLAVLRNFWLTIYQNRLKVTIGELVIDASNVTDILEQVFGNYDDNRLTINYNPLPYSEAVVFKGVDSKKYFYKEVDCNDEKCDFYEIIKHLKPSCSDASMVDFGKIEFYLYRSKEGSNRVLYMREPRMLVDRFKNSTASGFFALFVATHGVINQLLRLMENPAHNEWSAEQVEPHLKKDFRKLKTIIDEFVNKSIKEAFGSVSTTQIAIKGLDQYLYIPTEYDDDNDDDLSQALESEPISPTQDEGGSMTSRGDNVNKPSTDSLNKNGGVVFKRAQTNSTKGDKGVFIGGKSDRPINHRGGSGVGTRGTEEFKQDKDSKSRLVLERVGVSYRSFAITKDGELWHRLIINAPNDIESAIVKITSCGDREVDDINIRKSSVGSVVGNGIEKISLVKGKNTIDVKFEDKTKHSINLNVSKYENE